MMCSKGDRGDPCETASVRELAKIIDLLSSTGQAVLPAPLNYRFIQLETTKQVIKHKSYKTIINFIDNCIQELTWWVENIKDHNKHSSNSKLDKQIFHSLNKLFGPLETDLFAGRLNTELQKYLSWKPDPYAHAVDAFQLSWKKLKGYAFPLVAQSLAKIVKEQSTILLVAPTWSSQTYYPLLMQQLIQDPVLIPTFP
ncbi:unnamed protein product [Didymodactylos carnosus]|uniref:Uncharacterized protein n=1 Tax=Didymodactylos carnosus TaxID=1234261 RepID=A0A813NK68_9BILA|nr:unnamed protein product [Didymodactylos carnosus]CAF0739389.1 unnamed protein product [Didymodactylos carnosus]CAF3492409.1 unnamed protein product [Didymodactylos carnosus]CAF3517556.1 unnamed protein product [Didymodactylos carnosus]